MAVLLVTYDLNRPGQDYPELLKAIKGYAYAKLSESSYAILTDKTPQAVYSQLLPFIDKNDNLYVINLKQPYGGQGLKEVNDWLSKYLPW
jgi:hypothetical protein